MLRQVAGHGLLAEERAPGDRAVGVARRRPAAPPRPRGRSGRRRPAWAGRRVQTLEVGQRAELLEDDPRAASYSIWAESSSPSARQAVADAHPHPGGVVRHAELAPALPGLPEQGEGLGGRAVRAAARWRPSPRPRRRAAVRTLRREGGQLLAGGAAASTSPAASITSTYVASTSARSLRCGSASSRRMVDAASSTRPCASRILASPGSGCWPSALAVR